MDDLKRILFIDIETASKTATFEEMSSGLQKLWIKKALQLKPTDPNVDPIQLYKDKAGIFAEFARVVCIGLGCLVENNGSWQILLKSLTHPDEKTLLQSFCTSIDRFTSLGRGVHFCGHNIKEFDIPFLSRRMIIQGMNLPECMQLQGKKPWEAPHIDTMDLWSFGDRKSYTSLALLSEVLDIPTPKDDIDGSMVSPLFWSAQDDTDRSLAVARIATYCRKDVLTTARIFLKLRGLNDVQPEPVFIEE